MASGTPSLYFWVWISNADESVALFLGLDHADRLAIGEQ